MNAEPLQRWASRGALIVSGLAIGLFTMSWLNASDVRAPRKGGHELAGEEGPGTPEHAARRTRSRRAARGFDARLVAEDQQKVPLPEPAQEDEGSRAAEGETGPGGPLTPELEVELRERRRTEYQEKLARHREELEDPTWAPSARAAFVADLQAVGERAGFGVVDVACKTTTCTARLEWQSHAEALDSYNQVLHHRYASDCGREILLDDPEDEGARYEATALFHCEGATSARR